MALDNQSIEEGGTLSRWRKTKIKQKNPLKVISDDQVETLHHTDAEPSAERLAPRAFSVGVVDSLGEVFVWINPLDITALKKLEYSWDLFLRSQY